MLLFDQISELGGHYVRRLQGRPEYAREKERLAAFRRCPVYELSRVCPLFDDWQAQRYIQVPKRPPHDWMWAEWRAHERRAPNDGIDWTLGVLIEKLSLDALKSWGWSPAGRPDPSVR